MIVAKHKNLRQKREGDEAIIFKIGQYFQHVSELEAINRIFLACNIRNISELCSANGREVDAKFMISKPCTSRSDSFEKPVNIEPLQHAIHYDETNEIYL